MVTPSSVSLLPPHERNASSSDEGFDRILERHRALHDLSLPLVKADFDHSLDVWQWVLKLEVGASREVQVAALFHDVERLVSEPRVRIEHHATDYQAFKDAHARAGALLTRDTLAGLVEEASLARVCHLVERHERPGADEELALLNDADALSFFALNSPGFLRYYGLAHTKKKVAYTLSRLRPERRGWLPELALNAPIRALLDEALASERHAGERLSP